MDISFGSQGKTELTGPLMDGTCVRQTFIAHETYLDSVSLLLSTYCRQNIGRIIVEILDSKGMVLAPFSWCDATELKDNAWAKFKVDKQLIRGQKYELKVYARHCRAGASPTAHHGAMIHPGGHFFIGSKLQANRELCCRFYYGKEELSVVAPTAVSIQKGEEITGAVSVVIPHYNCLSYLGPCFASLRDQTYKPSEIIVVDDGSLDAVAVKEFVVVCSKMMPEISFLSTGTNKGAPAARNLGADKAQGEFLIFVDADCDLHSKALEMMVSELIDNVDVDFVYGGFRWGEDVIKSKGFDYEALKMGNYISTMSMMRRRVFGGFDETLKRHQDWDLWLTLAEGGSKGLFIPGILFTTPKRDGISSSGNISVKDSMDHIRQKHGIQLCQ